MFLAGHKWFVASKYQPQEAILSPMILITNPSFATQNLWEWWLIGSRTVIELFVDLGEYGFMMFTQWFQNGQ